MIMRAAVLGLTSSLARFGLVLATTVALALSARAAVTTAAYWRMGEIDSGVSDWAVQTRPTLNGVAGGSPLTSVGGPWYRNTVSVAAGVRAGSAWGLYFPGTAYSTAPEFQLTNNFGIEFWVRPDNVAGLKFLAYNGNTMGNGWGILQRDDTYSVFFGGIGSFGSAPAAAGEWAHLALVVDRGVATFYVNGVLISRIGKIPLPPVGGFAVATRPENPGTSSLAGYLDEVRVFTFAEGGFLINDLLVINGFAPAVTAVAPVITSLTSATINGTVTPGNFPTSAWFEWGTTTSYGNFGPTNELTGTAPLPVSHHLMGLVPGTTYHYRLAARNGLGAAYSADQSFTLLFTTETVGLPGVQFGDATWADFDNDNDLDFALFGEETASRALGRFFRNNGSGGFTVPSVGLPAAAFVSASAGDFDNDGDLDLLISGSANACVCGYETSVYRNDGGGNFSQTSLGLRGLRSGDAAWVDFDNDGALDVSICGRSAPGVEETHLYQNRNGTFVEVATNLMPVSEAAMVWGDYDGDGDADLFLAGFVSNPSSLKATLYRNDGNHIFTPASIDIPGVAYASAEWGDYDNDGDLDLAYSGLAHNANPLVRIYRNDGNNTFTDLQVFPAVVGRVAWGDFDNDGWLDLALVSGYSGANTSQIFHNEANPGGGRQFVSIGLELPSLGNNPIVALGDYHGDGRLDLLTGGYLDGVRSTYLFGNRTSVANTPPGAPSELTATAAGDGRVQFKWKPASDAQTPSAGLNYNLRVGRSPGSSDVVSPAANTFTGFRRLSALGNVTSGTSAWLNLPAGTYYWSVQAIDTSFAGGPFSPERSITIGEGPTLSLVFQGDAVTLSWPLSAADYFLVTSTNVTHPSANWEPVGLARQINGDTISVSVPLTAPVTFFQLRK